MKDYKELDIKEIKEKKKKIKVKVRNTVIGIVVGGILISLIPNIKYRIALFRAKRNEKVIELVNDKENRKENIIKIYELALDNNNNISEKNKALLEDSFEKIVINEYYEIFLDETLYNMYAVVSTQDVHLMSDFTIEHGWWSGDYNSYLNTIFLEGTNHPILIAHEQLHAILKNGLWDYGYTKGIQGYGINEAVTTSMVKDDYSYFDEYLIADYLGLIIGYDNLYKYYMTSDLDGLKKELNKYLTKEETNTLISNIDEEVYSDYGLSFLYNNNLGSEEIDEKAHKNKVEKRKEMTDIMKKLFESKYNCKIEESKLGRIIFGEGNDLFDSNWDSSKPLYDVYYWDSEHVRIAVHKFNTDIFNNVVPKNYYQTYIVKIDELEDFDIDSALESANSSSKHK